MPRSVYFYKFSGLICVGLVVFCCSLCAAALTSLKKKANNGSTITTNSATDTSHYIIPKKGDVVVHLSLPHVNSFHLVPDGEKAKNNTGFLGIAGGINYFHRDNQFVSAGVGVVADYFSPFVIGANYPPGVREDMRSMYVSLSNNHLINRFTFGYGLSYAANQWLLKDPDGVAYFNETELKTSNGPAPIDKRHKTLGFVSSAYFRVFDNFNIGLIYRPTILRLNTIERFKYEHIISLDFALRLPAR